MSFVFDWFDVCFPADFYDICDEVECNGADCPVEPECRCPSGTVLGTDAQTCLGKAWAK